MSTFPVHASRVSNLMMSRISLGQLARTNSEIFRSQNQLSTGLAINRTSDDAVAAAGITVLDNRLELAEQRLKNLQHADSSLNSLDAALGDLHDIILQAKSLALQEVNFPSSAEERANEALIVSSLLDTVLTTANLESPMGYMFGGSLASRQPVLDTLGGYRFTGVEGTILTDLGLGTAVPLTLSPNNALGATSIRKRGTADLNPPLTRDTQLRDVRGTRGLGINGNAVEFSFAGGPRVRVDLSKADTIGDAADMLERAIHDYEAQNNVTILESGGVSVTQAALDFDIVQGDADEPDPRLEFFNVGNNTAADDLGLAVDPFDATDTTGADLDPALTWLSPVNQTDTPLGRIRLSNAGQSVTLDFSGAETLQDIRNMVEGSGLGLRVEINDEKRGINIISDIATGKAGAMSIEEVQGGDNTATRLGIRTLAAETRIADFNDGRGVSIVTGKATDDNPDANVDFEINFANGANISVDLRPEDLITVSTLISRINSAAQDAGLDVPGDFSIGLSDGSNGLLIQHADALGAMTIEPRNGSDAAFGLGLKDGDYDPASGRLLSQDRATVRVDNLFTQLIDLRDALRNNDTSGITLAGERIEASVARVAESRALVGGYSQRVSSGKVRQEDAMLVDEKSRSQLRDLDFTEAAVRFNLLQTQLSAGLQAAAAANGRTLLDFLG